MTDPASIRYKNPGAMWGGNAISTKWGATKTVALNDGLGQGNNIADFPDFVSGACAQFDLWQHGYINMALQAAITKWSGGNSSVAYMNWLCAQTGLTSESIINHSVLAGPTGLALMKAQAHWEAGKVYPLSDSGWAAAQSKVFGLSPTTAPVVVQPPKETPVTDPTTTPATPAAPAVTSVLTTISAGATKAEAIVEDVMKIEPTIAMFVPGSSVWQPFIVMAAPFIERALNDIAAQNGGDILSAVIELLQHVTPAQPNSSALAPKS